MTALLVALAAAGLLAAPRAVPHCAPRPRSWVGVSAGVQAGTSSPTATVSRPLYAETEQIATRYPGGRGPIVTFDGGRYLSRRMILEGEVALSARDADADVAADPPHPFFFNQFRHVTGTAHVHHGELAMRALAGYALPARQGLELHLVGGPVLVRVSQTLVTDVQFSETYPYDTATFSGASTTRVRGWSPGIAVGADAFTAISRRVSAGAVIRYTRARSRLTSGSASTTIASGGVEIAAGLRARF